MAAAAFGLVAPPNRQETEVGRGVLGLFVLLFFGFCFYLLFKSHRPGLEKGTNGGLCGGSRVQTSYLETKPKVKSKK